VTAINETSKIKSGFQSDLILGNCNSVNIDCAVVTSEDCETENNCFSGPCHDIRDATLKCKKSGIACGLVSQKDTGPCAIW